MAESVTAGRRRGGPGGDTTTAGASVDGAARWVDEDTDAGGAWSGGVGGRSAAAAAGGGEVAGTQTRTRRWGLVSAAAAAARRGARREVEEADDEDEVVRTEDAEEAEWALRFAAEPFRMDAGGFVGDIHAVREEGTAFLGQETYTGLPSRNGSSSSRRTGVVNGRFIASSLTNADSDFDPVKFNDTDVDGGGAVPAGGFGKLKCLIQCI